MRFMVASWMRSHGIMAGGAECPALDSLNCGWVRPGGKSVIPATPPRFQLVASPYLLKPKGTREPLEMRLQADAAQDAGRALAGIHLPA